MSELVEAPASFYINASQYNDAEDDVDAQIHIEDRQDILKRSDDWFVNVVRWTIDTQATLNYLPADPSAVLTMEVFKYTRPVMAHGVVRDPSHSDVMETRQLVLDRPMATLSEFLSELNLAVPQMAIPDNPNAVLAVNNEQRFIGRLKSNPCGVWSVTADGKFHFKAREPAHQPTDQLFIKMRMTASMQKILGTDIAHIYTMTQQSRLVDWRNMLTFIAIRLTEYRGDVSNFRFTPSEAAADDNQHLREVGMKTDFEITVRANILKYLEKISYIQTTVAHHNHYAVGSTYDSHALTASIDGSQSFSEYTSMDVGGGGGIAAHYTVKKVSIFAAIHNHVGGVPNAPELLIQRTIPAAGPGAAFVYAQDMRHFPYPVAYANRAHDHAHSTNREVRSTRLHAGLWARSFILKIQGRKITVNRGDYTFTDGAGHAHTEDGGQVTPPTVGETLLIPDSTNGDGTGVLLSSVFRRFFITAVVQSTLANDHDATVQDTYEITVDGYIPTPAYARLVRTLATSAPIMHLVHTTKRAPWDPCVHYNRTALLPLASYDAGTGLTLIKVLRPFQCDVGGKVYIGIRPEESLDSYLVHSVADDGITFHVEGDVHQKFTTYTFLIAFMSDATYTAIHNFDLENSLLSASTQFIDHGEMCRIAHNQIAARMEIIHRAIAGRPSISDWGTYQTPHQTWGELTEAESIAPPAVGGVLHDGSVRFQFTARAAISDTMTRFCQPVGGLQDGVGTWPWVAGGAGTLQTGTVIWDHRFYKISLPPLPQDDIFVNFVKAHISEDLTMDMRNIDFAGLQITIPALPPTGVVQVGVRRSQEQVGTYQGFDPLEPHYVPYRNIDHNVQRRGPWKVCGIGQNENGRDMVIIWATTAAGLNFRYTLGKYTISAYAHSNAAVAVLKSNNTLHFAGEASINLACDTWDETMSTRSGQVDIAFPYKAIAITSQDLLHVPERSGDHNTMMPILSSFNLPSLFTASISASGQITGATSTPFGSVSFSESGARRYHELTPLPGGLRSFQLQAELVPKDSNVPRKRFRIPPGGRFSVQLLFVQKKKV